MVVEKEFKQTEVGVIPEDWELKELGTLGLFSKGSGVKKDQSSSGEIPCVRYGELYTKHNDYIKSFYSFISPEIAKSAKKITKGDILFAGSGETKSEIGKSVAFIDEMNAYAGGDIVIFSPKNIDSLFLGYLLNSPKIQSQKAKRGQGDAVVHISSAQLSSIIIPLPPLPEQTAIANALSDMDALIAQTSTLIEKKKAIKQGVMQELLKPKEGWVTKKLGENALILRGGSPRPIEDFLTTASDGINWIKIGDVGKTAKYITSTEEKITPAGMSRSRVVKPGDFLLSNSMSFGRPYIMQIGGCIHDGWLVITEYESNFDRDFLYYVLGSESVFTQYKSMASGSSVLNLNKEIVKEVKVVCPKNIEEQRHIAKILSDIDIDLDFTETKLQKLKLQKQGMMQALLTGKIRLI